MQSRITLSPNRHHGGSSTSIIGGVVHPPLGRPGCTIGKEDHVDLAVLECTGVDGPRARSGGGLGGLATRGRIVIEILRR